MPVQASILQADRPRAAWLAFTLLSSSFLYLTMLQIFARRSISFGAKNLLQYVTQPRFRVEPDEATENRGYMLPLDK